ncbi:MAG: hypothetical protein FWE71_09850 [Nocardioidaceae bacterium]|nr:hypothetical protein [Nocardioidaceae bacterium]MCL2611930.1 hypothetical protein [Nocardioidaceae bacterium]
MLNSLMRTIVPVIYSWLIGLGLSQQIPQTWVVDVITVALTGALYLLLRLLEQKWRYVGILLGAVGAPSYDSAEPPAAVEQAQAATKAELGDMLDALRNVIVGQVEARVHALVTGESARQTDVITAAVAAAQPVPAVLDTTTPAPAKKTAAKRAPRKTAAKKTTPPK